MANKDFSNYFSNPMAHGLKKFIHDLLGVEKFVQHQPSVEQISRIVYNQSDYEGIGKLFAKVYEAGFMRAVEEQKSELTRLGLKVSLKAKTADAPPIFNQKNPSDHQ